MTDIAREIEILLCCTRAKMEPSHVRRLTELLDDRLDWSYLMRMAGKHSVRPLLYRHLSKYCPGKVPVSILGALREQYQGNLQRNLRFTHELCGVLRLIEKEGIHAIPFKGPTLTLATLGNLALREFTDLDVYIHEKDVGRVAALLRERGYHQHFELGRAQEAEFMRYGSEHKFRNKEGDILLEIHWRFESRYFSFLLEPSDLDGRLQTQVLGEHPARVYSPEDQFLVLCVHGAKHVWWCLRWICDLAEVIRVHTPFDWAGLLSRARVSGAERMTLLGIRLAHELLDAPIPEHVLREVTASPALESLVTQVRSQLGAEEDFIPGMMGEVAFHLKAKERKRDKFRYCFRLAVTPTVLDLKLIPLPAVLSPLYFAMRPFRLAAKYCFGRLVSSQR